MSCYIPTLNQFYQFFWQIIDFFFEKRTTFSLENLGTFYSIFHNLRSWASFSHPFWIIRWMLQPLTTNGMKTILEIKGLLCTCTPCSLFCWIVFIVYYLSYFKALVRFFNMVDTISDLYRGK